MRSAGDDLISVAVADPAAAQALARALRRSGIWIEAVGGIDSVVVQFDLATVSRRAAEEQLAATLSDKTEATKISADILEIPVAYGGEYGPDLEAVCRELGMTEQEFIDLHSGNYVVEMLGFTPGFAYIGGLDERLSVDRLPEPRQFVPAGAVGIAGGRSGLYSLPGPGGWPLIGRTSRPLFDAESKEPFTLMAGARICFVPVDVL